MAEAVLVRPDRSFVEELIASGGGDLKKCMQCANCSVICELSDGTSPFPRKEMAWAQWGLKDRLLADPDVWLCHQCNDCSLRCPRGARPGDVLAAVRRLTVQHYSIPRALARWVSRAGMLPVTLLIPVVLLSLALLARGPIEAALGLEADPAFYASFFPHWLLIGFFSLFTGLAAVAAVVGLVRYWKAMEAADRDTGRYREALGIVPGLVRALRSVVTHDRFALCQAQAPRRTWHLAVFYGFVALFVVTVWATLDLYVLPPLFGAESLYPFGLLHPMKIVANVGGAFLVLGSVMIITNRRGSERPGVPASTSFDRIFVWGLLGVGVTGFAAEVFRFAAGPTPSPTLETVAYTVYFVHLVLVFQLLVYLPYSKFAHVLYRTVAMVYAERTGRHHPTRRRPSLPGARSTGVRIRPAPASEADMEVGVDVIGGTNGDHRLTAVGEPSPES